MAQQPVKYEVLPHLLKFQVRQNTPDEFGNSQTEFIDQFTEPARLIFASFGNETVVASRLEGRQPVIIKLRLNSRTIQIQSNWRAVDARNTEIIYAISAPPVDRDQTRRWLEIPAVLGAAA